MIQDLLPKLDQVRCLHLFYTLLNRPQIVSVLKLLLENSYGKSQECPKVDAGPTLHLLASLISPFLGYEASRTKTKFCAMCEIACDSQESLMLRKNTNKRHLILDIIMEWVQPTTVSGFQFERHADIHTMVLRRETKPLFSAILTWLVYEQPRNFWSSFNCSLVMATLLAKTACTLYRDCLTGIPGRYFTGWIPTTMMTRWVVEVYI